MLHQYRRAQEQEQEQEQEGLQSPQDRTTGKLLKKNVHKMRQFLIQFFANLDSPQVQQVYLRGSRIPVPYYPDMGVRYYEPPPAHRVPHNVVATAPGCFPPQPAAISTYPLSHMHKLEHEIELQHHQQQRDVDKERETRSSISGK